MLLQVAVLRCLLDPPAAVVDVYLAEGAFGISAAVTFTGGGPASAILPAVKDLEGNQTSPPMSPPSH